MLWNPFQYQYQATYLDNEGEIAVVELKKGSTVETLRLHRSLLPHELEKGQSFVLALQPKEVAQKNEEQVLKELLNELIR